MLRPLHNARTAARLLRVTCAVYAQLQESKCLLIHKRRKQLSAVLTIVITHLELAFAAFAKVPYHDTGAQWEFDQLFTDFDEARRRGSSEWIPPID